MERPDRQRRLAPRPNVPPAPQSTVSADAADRHAPAARALAGSAVTDRAREHPAFASENSSEAASTPSSSHEFAPKAASTTFSSREFAPKAASTTFSSREFAPEAASTAFQTVNRARGGLEARGSG